MKRNVHSHRSRSGLTGGWLLAVLAVLAVIVIIVLFVWRPGTTPGGPPSPPPAEETPSEEVPGDAPEPAEPEADGEAEPDEAEPDEAEDAAEEPGEAEEAAEESPGPVDAVVETESDEPLQADVRNREADFGGMLAEASERTAAAIDEAERRLEGLRRPEGRGEDAAADFDVETEPAASEARVRQVRTAGADAGERGRDAATAAAGSLRTERQQTEAAIDVGEGGDGAEGRPVSDARVRTLQADERIRGALDRARGDSGRSERTPRSQQQAADVEVGDGGAPDAEVAPEAGPSGNRDRSLTVGAPSLRDAVEDFEQRTRSSFERSGAAQLDEPDEPDESQSQ